MEIKGKVALVTGGSKGIGRGIAEALVIAGAQVCLTARKAGEVNAAATSLNELGPGPVTGKVCDVQDVEQVRTLFRDLETEFGGLDILVNNAGIDFFGSVETTSPEEFRA